MAISGSKKSAAANRKTTRPRAAREAPIVRAFETQDFRRHRLAQKATALMQSVANMPLSRSYIRGGCGLPFVRH